MSVNGVNNTESAGHITGKITASPNPVCFGQPCVISWETNDPAGVEVRVCIGSDDEKPVVQGEKSGHVEIPWITNSTTYEFRLYAASRPDVALDSVKTRRSIESAPAALRELADEVMRGNIDVMELSQFIATVLPRCTRSERSIKKLPVLEVRADPHLTLFVDSRSSIHLKAFGQLIFR